MEEKVICLVPVRKIRPSNRSITGKRPSQKTGVLQRFESTLERDYISLLEFDDVVDHYCVQPVTIDYVHEGKSRRYTPDVIVYYKPVLKRKPLLVEIKYEAELKEKSALYEPKFNAARHYAASNGFEFSVLTENDIRTDYLSNARFLSRYQYSPIDGTYAQAITSLFNEKIRLTAKEVLTGGDEETNGRILYTLWQMLAINILHCELHKKLTMNTVLWM